jgi:hypothetical protein
MRRQHWFSGHVKIRLLCHRLIESVPHTGAQVVENSKKLAEIFRLDGSPVGYLLALALMLPLNGWLVERIGAKSLYV